MFFRGALDSWKRCQHGLQVQAKSIEYIAERIEVLEAIQYEDDNYNIILKPILEDCKKCVTPDTNI